MHGKRPQLEKLFSVNFKSLCPVTGRDAQLAQSSDTQENGEATDIPDMASRSVL